MKTCKFCSSILSRSASYKGMERCQTCRLKQTIGTNHPAWKGGKSHCALCQKILTYRRSSIIPSCMSCRYKVHPRKLKQNAGYDAIHKWVQRHYGKPSQCEMCNIHNAKRYDWANISGKYLRIRSDWKRLCRRCHFSFDGRVAFLRSKETGRWVRHQAIEH